MAGDVLVDGQPVLAASKQVAEEQAIELRSRPRFVSRGGEKLAYALDAFGIDVSGLVCADLGASTGGFTDCLLQAGARLVYAIDVGYGQLDMRLRNDPRVIVMDRTNARHLESLDTLVEFVTADLSFISLRNVWDAMIRISKPDAGGVVLIKPQFEAGRGDVGKGGVVRDPAIHRRVLEEVLLSARDHGLHARGLVRSPLKGPAGNTEFLAWLTKSAVDDDATSIDALIAEVMEGEEPAT